MSGYNEPREGASSTAGPSRQPSFSTAPGPGTTLSTGKGQSYAEWRHQQLGPPHVHAHGANGNGDSNDKGKERATEVYREAEHGDDLEQGELPSSPKARRHSYYSGSRDGRHQDPRSPDAKRRRLDASDLKARAMGESGPGRRDSLDRGRHERRRHDDMDSGRSSRSGSRHRSRSQSQSRSRSRSRSRNRERARDEAKYRRRNRSISPSSDEGPPQTDNRPRRIPWGDRGKDSSDTDMRRGSRKVGREEMVQAIERFSISLSSMLTSQSTLTLAATHRARLSAFSASHSHPASAIPIPMQNPADTSSFPSSSSSTAPPHPALASAQHAVSQAETALRERTSEAQAAFVRLMEMCLASPLVVDVVEPLVVQTPPHLQREGSLHWEPGKKDGGSTVVDAGLDTGPSVEAVESLKERVAKLEESSRGALTSAADGIINSTHTDGEDINGRASASSDQTHSRTGQAPANPAARPSASRTLKPSLRNLLNTLLTRVDTVQSASDEWDERFSYLEMHMAEREAEAVSRALMGIRKGDAGRSTWRGRGQSTVRGKRGDGGDGVGVGDGDGDGMMGGNGDGWEGFEDERDPEGVLRGLQRRREVDEKTSDAGGDVSMDEEVQVLEVLDAERPARSRSRSRSRLLVRPSAELAPRDTSDTHALQAKVEALSGEVAVMRAQIAILLAKERQQQRHAAHKDDHGRGGNNGESAPAAVKLNDGSNGKDAGMREADTIAQRVREEVEKDFTVIVKRELQRAIKLFNTKSRNSPVPPASSSSSFSNNATPGTVTGTSNEPATRGSDPTASSTDEASGAKKNAHSAPNGGLLPGADAASGSSAVPGSAMACNGPSVTGTMSGMPRSASSASSPVNALPNLPTTVRAPSDPLAPAPSDIDSNSSNVHPETNPPAPVSRPLAFAQQEPQVTAQLAQHGIPAHYVHRMLQTLTHEDVQLIAKAILDEGAKGAQAITQRALRVYGADVDAWKRELGRRERERRAAVGNGSSEAGGHGSRSGSGGGGVGGSGKAQAQAQLPEDIEEEIRRTTSVPTPTPSPKPTPTPASSAVNPNAGTYQGANALPASTYPTALIHAQPQRTHPQPPQPTPTMHSIQAIQADRWTPPQPQSQSERPGASHLHSQAQQQGQQAVYQQPHLHLPRQPHQSIILHPQPHAATPGQTPMQQGQRRSVSPNTQMQSVQAQEVGALQRFAQQHQQIHRSPNPPTIASPSLSLSTASASASNATAAAMRSAPLAQRIGAGNGNAALHANVSTHGISIGTGNNTGLSANNTQQLGFAAYTSPRLARAHTKPLATFEAPAPALGISDSPSILPTGTSALTATAPGERSASTPLPPTSSLQARITPSAAPVLETAHASPGGSLRDRITPGTRQEGGEMAILEHGETAGTGHAEREEPVELDDLGQWGGA